MPTRPEPRKFLIIDDNADSRTILVRTLLRKFPEAVVQECQNGDTAIAIVGGERLSAVVAHRTFEYDGASLVRRLREAGPRVPIVMVSGLDRRAAALAAGADAFMDYDAWLTVGTVVLQAMQAREQVNRLRPTSASDLAAPEVA